MPPVGTAQPTNASCSFLTAGSLVVSVKTGTNTMTKVDTIPLIALDAVMAHIFSLKTRMQSDPIAVNRLSITIYLGFGYMAYNEAANIKPSARPRYSAEPKKPR